MKIFKDIHSLPKFRNAVITIGSFDGVHRGHQKIIQRINQLAHKLDGESVVITFHPHPRQIIYPKDKSLKLLNTIDEKLELLKKYGVHNVVIVPFSIEFSQQHPREYIEKFLIQKFNPRSIVIGYDHKFGLNRAGNIDLLKEYEEQHNFTVVEIQKQEIEDITISSTKVRRALESGNIIEANQFLNHKYRIFGKVVHGEKIGKTIGYPTANIESLNAQKLIPQDGVYAVQCNIDGLDKDGMMYIGKRPTIAGDLKRKIEVNIFDFNDDIYEKQIEIKVLAQVRGDEKFESLDDLKSQLGLDKIAVLKLLTITENVEIEKEQNVTIAILNWNGLEYLEAYLPSVLYSANSPINITVIDNNSTDDSVEYLKEWHPEVEVIELNKNHGFAGGYNLGMEDIYSKYTVILNSDVEVANFWLDPIISYLEEHENVGIVQPKILSLEEKDKFEYAGACGGFMDNLGYPYCRGRIFDTVEDDTQQYNEPIEIDWASGAAMVVRTKLFKRLEGFDSDYFAHMEEIDFCRRVKRSGYKIVVLPQSKVYHLGGGTLSYKSPKKSFLNFRNSLFTILKNEPISKLLWLIPTRLILDGVAGLKFALGGKFSFLIAIIKSHFAFYGGLVKNLRKRKHYNNLISKYKIANPETRAGKSSSIVIDYYLKGKKKFSDIK